MWEKIAEKLGDWAIATIGTMPPAQNLVAFFVVLALAMPILSAGVRLFRTHPAAAPAPEPAIQESPWFITTVTTMSVHLQAIQRDIDGIEQALGHIHNEMSGLGKVSERVERLLRSRADKARRRSRGQV